MKTHSEKSKDGFPKNLLVKPSDHKGVKSGEGVRVEESIIIERPIYEIYSFWRNFENLPRIMSFLVDVDVIDDQRSHWVAKTIAGIEIEWDAEIIQDKVGELIAWQSLEHSEMANSGSVRFTDLGLSHGCRVDVKLKYDPHGGKVVAGIGHLFGRDASSEIAKDLKNFKKFMETGAVETH